jgi:transposase
VLGYQGGYNILKDYLATLRSVATPEPLIRFETDPGRQMQADFASIRRGRDRLAGFIATLGWSRATYVEFVTDEQLETLGCHERAFNLFGGVPHEVLCDYVARHMIAFVRYATMVMCTCGRGVRESA